jgi:hypothetical protein
MGYAEEVINRGTVECFSAFMKDASRCIIFFNIRNSGIKKEVGYFSKPLFVFW